MGGVSGTVHDPTSRRALSWIINQSTRDSGFLLLVWAYLWSTIIIDSSLTRPDYYFSHVCCYLMGVLMLTDVVERFNTV